MYKTYENVKLNIIEIESIRILIYKIMIILTYLESFKLINLVPKIDNDTTNPKAMFP